ncbi:MAG TPA: alpha/beta fold hydrolase [Steroidobacteraceae bacterium]|nr:alpha/beta fold hydrolase [Steroidobacteraceae bacterium]
MGFRRALCALLVTLSATSPLLRCAASAQTLKPAPCTLGKVQGLCGTFFVPEDRSHPERRMIGLRIFEVPATAAKKPADPLFLIEGGPGISTVEHLSNAELLGIYRQIARNRDIVAIEERGVGQSNGLTCPEPARRTLKDDFVDLVESAHSCLPTVQAHAAPDQYHSLNAIADLDAVRAALGYDKIDLWGLSHGTREALLYAERYPQHARAVVLEAPFGPDEHMPAGLAEREDEVLRGTFADCAADHDCAAQYPNLQQDYQQALAAFAHGPVQVKLTDPYTKRETTIALSKGRFAETIRDLLYAIPLANQVPALLHSAAGGDWKPLVLFSAKSRIADAGFPFGMWLSYVCAEDLPYIDAGRERLRSNNTLLGNYRVEQQEAACGIWPAAHLPKGWDWPTGSKVPILFMVGALDVITSPALARRIAAPFPNAKVVEVAHGTHLLVGQPGEDDCVLRIERDFIEQGQATGLETACAASLARGPWK